jgi:hypothetical protein
MKGGQRLPVKYEKIAEGGMRLGSAALRVLSRPTFFDFSRRALKNQSKSALME